MEKSDFISNKAKNEREPANPDKLSDEIKRWIEKIDRLNGDRLEIKAAMALKNKFITPKQEKELFVLVNNDTLHNRYSGGEITPELLGQLKDFHRQLKRKKDEIFPDAPQGKKLGLVKKGGESLSNKEKNMSEFKEPQIIKSAEKQDLAVPEKKEIEEDLGMDDFGEALDINKEDLGPSGSSASEREARNEMTHEKPKIKLLSEEEVDLLLGIGKKSEADASDLVADKSNDLVSQNKLPETREEKINSSEELKANDQAEKISDKKKEVPDEQKKKPDNSAEDEEKAKKNEVGEEKKEVPDKGKEEEIRTLIQNVQNRQELLNVIDSINGIQAADRFYDKEYLKKIIVDVLDSGDYENAAWSVPLVGGLGGKIDEIRKKEKEATRSVILKERRHLLDVMEKNKEEKLKQEAIDKKKEEPAEQKKEEVENEKRLPVEQLKQEVEKARAEYIKSEIEAKKADKSLSKLGKLRERLFGGKKEGAEGEKDSAAKKDKEERKKLNEEKRIVYEEAKKVFAKGLYDEHRKSFEEMAKEGGENRGPVKSEHREILLAKLKFDVVRTTILDERENFNNAKFEALPKKEQGLCRKAMARYGQLPPWSKVLISAGVATGATIAFSSGAGFAMVGGVFAWKALRAGIGTTAGLLAGKGYNWAFDKMIDVKNIKNKGEQEIINEIEKQVSLSSKEKEKTVGEKKEEEFGKWFAELSSSTNEKLDKLATKERRILLGKAIGQGIVIAGVAGATSWGMERIGVNLGLSPTANLARPKVPPENVPKAKAAGILDSHKEAVKVNTVGIESAKAKEVLNFKIGVRGPEGAIIDNFKANPKLAESFGYKSESGISLDKWAGSKAHELWSKSVEADLKNPKIIAELAKHGYQTNPEDYARAMHKIGKGFVELDPKGDYMHLSDETSFLKATPLPIENSITIGDQATTPEGANLSGLASVESMQGATEIKPLSGVENLMNSRIKETVARLFKPEILTDKTFKVAAKVPLSKILEVVPPEVYENKYSLSHYWLNLDHEVGLPGSSWLGVTYDDFRKYSEMAKFLREEAGVGVAEKLKDMTVEDFFKTYGGGLTESAGSKPSVGSIISNGLIPEGEINLPEPTPGAKINLPEPVKISGEGVVPPAQESIDVLKPAPETLANLPLSESPEAPRVTEASLPSEESASPAAPEEPAQGTAPEAPINQSEPIKISGQEAGVGEVPEMQDQVGGAAPETATVAAEKQEIIKNLIGSRASVSMAAVKRLTAGVKAGDLSVEDVANYYAQNIKTNTPAATLTPENMNQFRETFSTAINGSGATKMKSLDTIRIMLERLRQNK